MLFLSNFKSTVLLWFLVLATCGNETKEQAITTSPTDEPQIEQEAKKIVVAANRTEAYIPLLKGKKIAVVANQTSVIFKPEGHTHLVDSLLSLNVDIKHVFAPEHGFRGNFDAGEHVNNSKDIKTGLDLISLHGKNRKPSQEQLEGVDLVVFDIQDVGVRFYTYISTMQLVMEACAEKGIPVLVLDRPNPNGHYVDGPTMEAANTSFLGMTEIPLVYGMTIGEYANMINEENWLEGDKKADLTVIPLENWTYESFYSLPIRPSPNLPNDTSITLYPSLGMFEGTNINAGRGTEFQFQRYGASFLDVKVYDFTYIPEPNFGSKYPKEEGKLCYGKDLSKAERMNEVTMDYIIDAYTNSVDKSKFFLTSGFTKHAGNDRLQKQIEAGATNAEIKATWQDDIEKFKKIRAKYLLY
ncbi:exo-beta-N-acetylmuramidase NamZ domain-containing protein [Maribacter sp. Asnod2-G09]|uniref:exo-beta-N-acetylmuramidase NamZ family protein n=1 Tax=Maribacter sp. Asnod2-G09 TaxID=3160577 RepID=UPI003863C7BB